jgi:protein-S-isoprenylcysteine O-methyltransferase Ste14
MLMTAKNFSLLAAVIFAIVAILQLAHALSGAPITIGTTFSVPVWVSWIACIIALALAWIGFSASRVGR